uniref:Uncharacterized protein n=13 Tax=Nymphaea colorata TaxID=210225 RepID=A0A5K1BN62_9MAGN
MAAFFIFSVVYLYNK